MALKLKELLVEDPYVVPIKIKKEKKGKMTMANNLVIRESTSDAPTESQQSSPSESSSDHQRSPASSTLPKGGRGRHLRTLRG